MSKAINIIVQGHAIGIKDEKMSLTDIANSFSPSNDLIESWLKKKDTIEFLAAWEALHNPNFNYLEFEVIRNEAGTNRFSLSVGKWVSSTNAIGIESKAGRQGGTFAHKDIATEFCSYVSPVFRLFLIKEFDRLKSIENKEWDINRVMSRTGYHLQTLAVKEIRIPNENIPKDKEGYAYAEEADYLNYAVFGYSAKAWKEANPELAKRGLNAREFASVNELTVLTSMESMNSVMIRSGMSKYERGLELRKIAQHQLEVLNRVNPEKSIRKTLETPSKTPILKRAQEIINPEAAAIKKAITNMDTLENKNLSFGDAIKKISNAGKPKE